MEEINFTNLRFFYHFNLLIQKSINNNIKHTLKTLYEYDNSHVLVSISLISYIFILDPLWKIVPTPLIHTVP